MYRQQTPWQPSSSSTQAPAEARSGRKQSAPNPNNPRGPRPEHSGLPATWEYKSNVPIRNVPVARQRAVTFNTQPAASNPQPALGSNSPFRRTPTDARRVRHVPIRDIRNHPLELEISSDEDLIDFADSDYSDSTDGSGAEPTEPSRGSGDNANRFATIPRVQLVTPSELPHRANTVPMRAPPPMPTLYARQEMGGQSGAGPLYPPSRRLNTVAERRRAAETFTGIFRNIGIGPNPRPNPLKRGRTPETFEQMFDGRGTGHGQDEERLSRPAKIRRVLAAKFKPSGDKAGEKDKK
ncbi:hypothetical protein GGR52DRAFT_575351 [Hypoxylon sp. FL1284]|nr:hypothetical protein GGR52DRAFT_575351 [Hypoxylon sp. FL1284]